jgi:hypothetical protein
MDRVERDWNYIERKNLGIKYDMLIKIPVNCIVVFTFDLRIRIIEKFISSVLSSIVNKERNNYN